MGVKSEPVPVDGEPAESNENVDEVLLGEAEADDEKEEPKQRPRGANPRG